MRMLLSLDTKKRATQPKPSDPLEYWRYNDSEPRRDLVTRIKAAIDASGLGAEPQKEK